VLLACACALWLEQEPRGQFTRCVSEKLLSVNQQEGKCLDTVCVRRWQWPIKCVELAVCEWDQVCSGMFTAAKCVTGPVSSTANVIQQQAKQAEWRGYLYLILTCLTPRAKIMLQFSRQSRWFHQKLYTVNKPINIDTVQFFTKFIKLWNNMG